MSVSATAAVTAVLSMTVWAAALTVALFTIVRSCSSLDPVVLSPCFHCLFKKPCSLLRCKETQLRRCRAAISMLKRGTMSYQSPASQDS